MTGQTNIYSQLLISLCHFGVPYQLGAVTITT